MTTPTLVAEIALPATTPKVYGDWPRKERWRLSIWVEAGEHRVEYTLQPQKRCRLSDMLETATASVHEAWAEAEAAGGPVTCGGFELWRLPRKRVSRKRQRR